MQRGLAGPCHWTVKRRRKDNPMLILVTIMIEGNTALTLITDPLGAKNAQTNCNRFGFGCDVKEVVT